MKIFQDYSLQTINTFGLFAKAKLFVAPKSVEELKKVISNKELMKEELFVLGGGSNVLFVSDFEGLIIHPQLKGIEIIEENDDFVLVKAHAGEEWDTFVEWTVKNGYGGIENLSLIPGTVGACPVQNIGAYGVEVAETIEKVETIALAKGTIHEFSKAECNFSYRNSIFKKDLKGKYLITSVFFKLNKNLHFITHYGAVDEELKKIGKVSLATVRQAVINIRNSKLPKPEEIPNAGSFFKNPVVDRKQFDSLKERYPEIVVYKIDENHYKIAAGWMIDYLGWKGKTYGGAAVHEKQALVLINKNNAVGKDVLSLAKNIQHSVYENFKVNLEFEINILGN